ncbi:hypothetical protein BGX21_004996, partial [Mortierella sp. AD011]
MQVRHNFQQKLRQESLGDIIEESQNMMEPGSAIYGTGRNDSMVSEFGVQKALEGQQGFASQPSTSVPIPTSHGTGFGVTPTTTAEMLARFSSSRDVTRDQGSFLGMQQQLPTPVSPLAAQHMKPQSSNSTQDGIHYNANIVLEPGVDYERQQPWLWGASRSGSSSSAQTQVGQQHSHQEYIYQQRHTQDQQNFDNMQLRHQTSALNPPLWSSSRVGTKIAVGFETTPETVSNDRVHFPSQRLQPLPLVGGQEFEISQTRLDSSARRRSSMSKPMSLRASSETDLAELHHRPRALSVTALPMPRVLPNISIASSSSSYSPSIVPPGPRSASFAAGRGGIGAVGFPPQFQNNTTNSTPSTSSLATGGIHSSALRDTMGYDTDMTDMTKGPNCSSSNNYGTATSNAQPSTFEETSLMDPREYNMDLTTLLSSDISDLGFHQGSSSSLTHSTTSSTSSCASESPTISNASVTTPMETSMTLSQNYFHPFEHQSSQAFQTQHISCPVGKCPNVFTRMCDLEEHFISQHNMDLKEAVSMRLPQSGSTSSPPPSPYGFEQSKSSTSAPLLPPPLHPTPIGASSTSSSAASNKA